MSESDASSQLQVRSISGQAERDPLGSIPTPLPGPVAALIQLAVEI
jgi:hypothetical protein